MMYAYYVETEKTFYILHTLLKLQRKNGLYTVHSTPPRSTYFRVVMLVDALSIALRYLLLP
jgi:hypothetical protein